MLVYINDVYSKFGGSDSNENLWYVCVEAEQ